MPHSSGGGSSHGGSHHSRSRSNPASMRYGTRYYPGARRYRYFRNGNPEYYYSDRPYTLQAAAKEKRRSILSSLFTAVMGVIFAVAGIFGIPHKVKTDYNTEIIIRDTAQLLTADNEKEISAAFSEFQDKTGVTPAFYTVTEEDKQGRTLESYAYNLYVNTFDDEKHWLIVYNGASDGSFWEWEGMLGDDCGSIITSDLQEELTNRMQGNLEYDPQNIAGAVIDAFTTVAKDTGDFSFKVFGGMGLTLLFGLLCLYAAGKKIFRAVKTDPSADPRIDSEPVPETEAEAGPKPETEPEAKPEPKPEPEPQTVKCEHCGGEFVPEDRTTCPFCGAPLEKWD